MGLGFWAMMALIGVLVLLIVYAQVQGVTLSCPVNLTGTNWTLTYYTNEKGTMVPVTNGTDVTIRFGLENGTILSGIPAATGTAAITRSATPRSP